MPKSKTTDGGPVHTALPRTVDVSVELTPRSYLPQYARPFKDGGMDIRTNRVVYDKDTQTLTCNTGVTPNIPQGYIGLIIPRRDVGDRVLLPYNSMQVIYEGEQAEIQMKFRAFPPMTRLYNEDDLVGILMVIPFETVIWQTNN